MADPEAPEVRAEIQREDRPGARNRYDQPPPKLGAHVALWAISLAVIVGIIAYAYGAFS